MAFCFYNTGFVIAIMRSCWNPKMLHCDLSEQFLNLGGHALVMSISEIFDYVPICADQNIMRIHADYSRLFTHGGGAPVISLVSSS